ncbi:putative bifunctional diguanylate cyclase/phosphodiesterase [Quadrisphaera sp. GCM10027208]|uniref:putative bifunctional diguanylate cyclase/phosphodiesterase n=1 Tax=Quadrisphaera sp. GCM10027208 TaxID=3273423 RepID=UPI003613FFB2
MTSATDVERERPAPARPAVFWVHVVTVPVLAVLLVAWQAVTAGPWWLADGQAFPTGAAVALAVGVVLVVGGELWPVLGSRTVDPSGVAWSTTFAFAVLLFAGLLPAVALLAGASVLSGVLARKAAYRWVFNAGQYSLSLLAAWGVLVAFDRDARPTELWSPADLSDLGVVALAAAAYFVVNELLVTFAVSALSGTSLLDDLRSILYFELVANGAQLGLAPLVAVVMEHAPALTALGVLPVLAIHRQAVAERESRHAATHDDLTQLANRKHFVTLAESAMDLAARSDQSLALLVVDLDRFKEVNDVLGHQAGDRTIVEVGRRLRHAVRDGDVVARLGGDEFAVLVPAITSVDDALGVAERVVAELERPFEVEGRLVDLGGSVGVALLPQHAGDFEALFSRADAAMFAAKRDGGGIRVYGPELDSGATGRVGLLGSLRRAIEAGDLVVEYQPKIDMRTGATDGVEALVRWRTTGGVLVLPDDFVPLAEQSGLMPRLTASVLEQALAQCAAWQQAGLRVPVAVNVSLRDVLDARFAVGVAERLVRYGVLGPMLTLEITERVLAEDMLRVQATLEELSGLGVRVSLDDFGTGWSSLVLLRRLPVAEVKLDRSFVAQVARSRSDAAIVRAVIDLAHELDLVVVAEGVEDAATWSALAAMGCDTAQGWHIARSLPAPAATAWVRERAGDRHGARQVGDPRDRPQPVPGQTGDGAGLAGR